MKENICYEILDENGRLLAVRKTEKGVQNWKAKHKVERIGGQYTLKGKNIYIVVSLDQRKNT
mgnify:CR=1 FL=1